MWLTGDSALVVGSYGKWFDLSGNGNDGTQSTVSGRPVQVTNAANGKAVVRFNSTNGSYLNIPYIMGAATNGEAFMVVKVIDNGGWLRQASSAGSRGSYVIPGSVRDYFGTVSAGISDGPPVTPTTNYFVLNSLSGSTSWECWLNGTVAVTRL